MAKFANEMVAGMHSARCSREDLVGGTLGIAILNATHPAYVSAVLGSNLGTRSGVCLTAPAAASRLRPLPPRGRGGFAPKG